MNTKTLKAKETRKAEIYLDAAEELLLSSTCLRRAFGAVIVNNDGEVISQGWNASPKDEFSCLDANQCQRTILNIPHGERYELCRSIHAEQMALLNVAKEETQGATLYLVGKDLDTGLYNAGGPCKICIRFIKEMSIEKVVMRLKKYQIKVLWVPEDLDYEAYC